MRYRLRTLLMVLAVAPPVLAGLCLAPSWLMNNQEISQGMLVALIIASAAAVYLVFAFGIGWALAWVWNTIADWMNPRP